MRLLAVLSFSVALCWSVFAQADIRSVHGKVTFSDGEPATGAVVKLANTKTLQIRSYITKADGAYAFHGLSTDIDYELQADYKGASSSTERLSQFDTRKDGEINLKIPSPK